MNKHIQLIKSEADMPGELIPNAIIMNGMDKTLKIGEAITKFEGVKEFTSLQQAEELNHYNTVGAVLSYDNGVFKAWNGDPENLEWNYKEFPDGLCVGATDTSAYFRYPNDNDNYSMNNGMAFINNENWIGKDANSDDVILYASIPTTHGTPIAVCVGKGLWHVLNWQERNSETGAVTFKNLKWATSDEGVNHLYNDFVMGAFRTNDGAEATKAIYQHQYLNESPLFTAVKNFSTPGGINIPGVAGRCFVPSIVQNREIWFNLQTVDPDHYKGSSLNEDYDTDHTGINFRSKLCCALLYSNSYSCWSSSQYSSYNYAFYLDYDGFMFINTKDIGSRSFVCLHFGDALAS